MADDRDFYADYADTADADYLDDTLVPPPPRWTPSQLRAVWASLVKQGDPDNEDNTPGWPIREDPPTPDAAANEKKESKK